MLAKLLELVPDRKPRDDENVYPAPWEDSDQESATHAIPHMTHLSDSQLINYLAAQKCDSTQKILQQRLARGLLYRRSGRKSGMYRTLLVVDFDLVRASKYGLSVFTEELRGKDKPSSEGRIRLETRLALVSGAKAGQVIIYCPSEKMQAKEIDVRLEIKADSVLPLRELAERNEFVDIADVDALRRHYEQLWRAYVFVSPELFEDKMKCQAVVDAFCEEFAIPPGEAYKKVRTHRFRAVEENKPADIRDRGGEVARTDGATVHTDAIPDWANRVESVQSRGTLLKFVKRKNVSKQREEKLWYEYLHEERRAGERAREGSLTEKDWAERNDSLDREEREPKLIEE